MVLLPPKGALGAGLWLTLLLAWGAPGETNRVLTVQEALWRAKPAVALVIAEVVAEVSLNCVEADRTVVAYCT